MRILYGVVGEGMGHALRSKVVLDYLVSQGHEILIVVSGRAHRFLRQHFEGPEAGKEPRVEIEEIHGLHLNYEGNSLALIESVATNIRQIPRGLATNLETYRRVVRSHFEPEAVVSDFESWAYFYGRVRRLPVISIDNMQIIDRCVHERELISDSRFDFNLAKQAVRVKLRGAYHYLVTTFFYPLIRKPRTTLVPPVLRPEILRAHRAGGEHVLVYQTAAANPELVPLLRSLPYRFRVYGMGREGHEKNVTLCPFSESAFVEDLRTARAVISNGSFTVMGEAVHLRVPMLSVPLEGQFEQELNARYLAKLGYGACTRKLDRPTAAAFLDRLPEFERALRSYPARGNGFLYRCLDELLWRIGRGEPPPASLSGAALGHYGRDLEEEEAEPEPDWH